MKFKQIFSVWLLWRVGLFAVSALAISILPVFGNRFPYRQEVLQSSGLPQWVHQFGNFDGVHYIRIAQDGYQYQFTQAFFPLYPLLIRLVAPIFLETHVLAGICLSSVFMLMAAWMLGKLIDVGNSSKQMPAKGGQAIFVQMNKDIAWVILFFLFFPMSFYFGAIYNESLFMFLVIGSFYFARQKKWWLAGVFGALASAARLVGVFLLPAIAWEYFRRRGPPNRRVPTNLYFLFLIPLGLLAYMIYLQINFGDALYFLHAQGAFGASRATGIVFPGITIWRYMKMFATIPFSQYDFWVALWEAGFFIFGGILLMVGYLRKIDRPILLFSVLSYLLPLFTGTLSSSPRYLVSCLAIYLVLASINNKIIKYLILAGFIILNFIFSSLFLRGYWVS